MTPVLSDYPRGKLDVHMDAVHAAAVCVDIVDNSVYRSFPDTLKYIRIKAKEHKECREWEVVLASSGLSLRVVVMETVR